MFRQATFIVQAKQVTEQPEQQTKPFASGRKRLSSSVPEVATSVAIVATDKSNFRNWSAGRIAGSIMFLLSILLTVFLAQVSLAFAVQHIT